ncbi:tellurite resistance TerB family protein [Rhizobium sp. KVB221]|uniref:Tellurite resistance TerB family protein n=1 Tax=Rhizobium setariae TaxID=2801340 RepID=A0A936YTM8_9HYPH|nr:tellurite resistance TerB family protein [Rhizobium setariae]MBL0372240.1 tellurite resistance TerB family protein [Rhizobium setariae]
MFDARKLLDQLLGSQVPGAGGTVKDRAGQLGQMAKDNPLVTGAIAAVLLGTGTGRQLTGSALKLGGLAAIAGLGYQAYKNWQDGQQPQTADAGAAASNGPELLPAPTGTGFGVEDDANSADFAVVLVRAMIAAARADGHIDDAEREAILGKVKLAGLGADAQAFLESELASPVDLDAIVGAARTDSQKVELYTASRIAIEPDSRAERGYLDLLAGRLGLADALVDHIEATVSSAKVA